MTQGQPQRVEIHVGKGLSMDVLQQSQLLRVQGSSRSPSQLCRGDKTCSSSQVTLRSLANLSPHCASSLGLDAFRGTTCTCLSLVPCPFPACQAHWSGNGAALSSCSLQSSEKPSGCLTGRLRGRCRSATDSAGTSSGRSATTPPTQRSSRCWASPNQKVTASRGQGGTSNSCAPCQQVEGYIPCRKNPAGEGTEKEIMQTGFIPV